MEDPKLILSITAFDVLAAQALGLSHNRPYLSSLNPVVEDATSISSRETTPFAEAPQELGALHLSLDDELKDIQSGWVFGSDPELCDILLSSKRKGHGISKRHFCITFDAQRRLVLNDTSTYGSRVSYSGQGQKKLRHGFTWILFEDWKIQIHIHEEEFIFNLQLAPHKTCEDDFQSRMSSFLVAKENAAPPLDLLRIRSQVSTAPPTQPLSPRKRPIYILVRKLGEGAFGSVHEARDVSTGNTYAAKQFAKSVEFELEVEILRRISHKHIIEFVDITEGPSPLLVMEYMKLGDLHHLQRLLSPQEAEMLLGQSLEALDYLHDQNITHRDIKPENILIKGRRREFHVKLADFGLSKDVLPMKTWCGTGPYAAPEIWDTYAKPTAYTNRIDIWSLGVVMLEVYRAVRIEARSTGLEWCRKIARTIDDLVRGGPDAPMFLIGDMLELDQRDRLSAKDCLQRFHDMDLGGSDWSDSDTECDTDSGIGSVTVTEDVLSENSVAEDTSDTGSRTPRVRSPNLKGPSEAETFLQGSLLDLPNQRQTKRRRSPDESPPRQISDASPTKRRQAQNSLGILSRSHQTFLLGPLWQVNDESRIFGTREDDVLALLQNLPGDRRSHLAKDERAPSVIASICEHLTRLEIDHLDINESNGKNSVTITAVSERTKFVLGILTASELSSSTGDLALCLLLMLRLKCPEGSHGTERRRHNSKRQMPSITLSPLPKATHSTSSQSTVVKV